MSEAVIDRGRAGTGATTNEARCREGFNSHKKRKEENLTEVGSKCGGGWEVVAGMITLQDVRLIRIVGRGGVKFGRKRGMER